MIETQQDPSNTQTIGILATVAGAIALYLAKIRGGVSRKNGGSSVALEDAIRESGKSIERCFERLMERQDKSDEWNREQISEIRDALSELLRR